ncbi:MAG: SHOCT domain-containing protein [Patescibacteria group bacterium]
MMYAYGIDGGWFGNMFFGGFFMIIFWVAIIFFVVWLVREMSGSNKKQEGKEHHARTALGILNERYAKGEIDRKEFEEKKKDLSS